MKTAALLLLWLAGASSAGGALASTLSAAAPAAALVRLAGSVLRVEAPTVNGTLAVGSAVTVAPERVVTNCHVTRDARALFVIRGGVRWEAEAQRSDVERDLCLLHVPGLVSTPVPLGAASQLAVGQKVAALGFTGGAAIQRSLGDVLELHRHDGGRVIKSSSWFSSGASGGGLFDHSGALVGVLTFRLRGGQAHWFAAPVEWVRQMLDETLPARPRDAAGVAYWQRPVHAQPHFLRAAVMQRDSAWADLAALSHEWLASDESDPEPWQLLGIALEKLDRAADALHAFECALKLAPEHALLRSQALALRARAPSIDATVPQSCRPARP